MRSSMLPTYIVDNHMVFGLSVQLNLYSKIQQCHNTVLAPPLGPIPLSDRYIQ